MIIPSNPEDRKKIYATLSELSASMTRIEGERDFIKEAINDTCKNFNLSKKAFRKLAKVYHKQNFSEEVAENDEFVALYETITGHKVED